MAYFNEINIGKGIATLLVILGHSPIVYPINMQEIAWCRILTDIIYSFHMPCFFILSGFLFAHSKKGINEKITSSVKRILVPYLSFSFFFLLIKSVLPKLVNRKVETVESTIYQIILYGGDLWFLYVLFVIFIIFIFLKKYLNSYSNCFFLLITLLITHFTFTYFDNNIFLSKSVIYYSSFFLIGFVSYSKYSSIKNKLNNNNSSVSFD